MAYSLLKTDARAHASVDEYVADSPSDVSNLPNDAPFGSTVFVLSTSEKYMKNSSGTWVKIADGGGSGGGGGGGVFEMNVATTTDPETGKGVLTTDKTAEELFDAIIAGKKVRVLTTLTFPSEEGTFTVEVTECVSVSTKKMVADIGTFFAFCFVDVDSDDGILGFVSSELSADDTVVFHEV